MNIANQHYSQMGVTLIAALSLSGLSDFLLYDGQIGLSLVILGVAVAITALIINKGVGRSKLVLGGAIYILSLLPIIENISTLSIAVFLALGALGILLVSNKLRGGLFECLQRFCQFFFTLPVRSIVDIIGWRKKLRRVGEPVTRFAKLGVWLMPLAFGTIFIALFEDANPIIANLVSKLTPWQLLDLLDVERIIFWSLMFIVIWPFLGARLPARKKTTVTTSTKSHSGESTKSLAKIIFGPEAILRALAIFNLLFAVQTLLDATYLVGGVSLPEGMTYASYAHRGAYSLIITVLLAAAFVLLLLREDSEARKIKLIRVLVYFWVAQNILLVLSSILRLDLYINVYGLTYWRVAALIWMALIAIGLLLIVWRIWSQKSTAWLVGCNILTTGLTLYVCCFVSFAGLIAHINLRLERPDFYYMTNIGAHVIPAIDQFLDAQDDGKSPTICKSYCREVGPISLKDWRFNTADDFIEASQKWRVWSLRNWRLQNYFVSNPNLIAETTNQPHTSNEETPVPAERQR